MTLYEAVVAHLFRAFGDRSFTVKNVVADLGYLELASRPAGRGDLESVFASPAPIPRSFGDAVERARQQRIQSLSAGTSGRSILHPNPF